MTRYRSILLVLVVLALAAMACNLPTARPQETPVSFLTPTVAGEDITATAEPAVTNTTGPVVVTATTAPQPATATPTSTATQSSGNNNGGQTTCTYRASFVADVTIPDDSRLSPGVTFTKTWRVRNDGNCAWGPNLPLNALAFTGGSRLGAVDQVSLPATVQPGQTVDISVTMVAPTSPGTYTSEWKFRLGNGYLGLGSAGTQPLFTRIIVGPTATPRTPTVTPTVTPTPVASTRITFASGGTQAVVDGSVNAGGLRNYVIGAAQGQLLMMSASSAATDLRLKLIDATTNEVISNENDTDARVQLPRTGDYIIQVVGGASNANFTLSVIIPARITFSPGSTSATLDGKISNRLANVYLLRAMANQVMTVTVTSPGGGLALTIYGLEDGQPLVRADMGLSSWTGNLNLTQDYVIMVVPNVDTATYTLETIVN